MALDPTVVRAALRVLAPYVPPARVARYAAVLRGRTEGARLVLENLADPHNGAGPPARRPSGGTVASDLARVG
jgi:hypothetical protein